MALPGKMSTYIYILYTVYFYLNYILLFRCKCTYIYIHIYIYTYIYVEFLIVVVFYPRNRVHEKGLYGIVTSREVP